MTTLETIAIDANLLPLVDLNRERREERRRVLLHSRRHLAALGTLVLLAVTVLLPLTFQVIRLYAQRQQTERQAQGVQQRLQSISAAGSRMDARISVWTRLVQTQQARRAWSAALPALAVCLPDNVFLQQVQISKKGTDAQIELQGSAETITGMHDFTEALARSAIYGHVHLDETTANHAAGPNGVSFQMAGPLGGDMTSGAASSSP